MNLKMSRQTMELMGVAKEAAVTVVVASTLTFAINHVFTPKNARAVVNKVKAAKDVVVNKIPITITIGGK